MFQQILSVFIFIDLQKSDASTYVGNTLVGHAVSPKHDPSLSNLLLSAAILA